MSIQDLDEKVNPWKNSSHPLNVMVTFEISSKDKLGDLIAEDNLFFEPYQELWKKILGTTFYIIEVLAGLFLIALIKYESGGHAGHFRTAFNQLNSWKHVIVSIEISTYMCKLQPIKLSIPYSK